MPQYEFRCDQCGSFECRRPLAEAGTPMLCPRCQTVAKRVYTPPGLVKTAPELGNAFYRSEKSAHEPEVLRRERPAHTEEQAPQFVYHSHRHPWMIGH